MLTAALLGSWQLLGITIDTKEKWGISVKSPSAVPVILFVLLVYFGYKVTIEWIQCDSGRKMHPAALLDFRIAHVIAVVAVLIAIIQYVLQRQLFDVIASHVPRWILIVVLTGFVFGGVTTTIGYGVLLLLKHRSYVAKYYSRWGVIALGVVLCAVSTATLVALYIVGTYAPHAISVYGFGVLLVFVVGAFLGFLTQKYPAMRGSLWLVETIRRMRQQ